MHTVLNSLYADEAGFIVSAELVIVATILVIGMVVGLAEVANGTSEELEDVGSAIGSFNQGYLVSGMTGHKALKYGSKFHDKADFCDGQDDLRCDLGPVHETPRHYDW